MRRSLIIILLCLPSMVAFSESNPDTDSIVNKVMRHAEKYGKLIETYDANVYMRTYISTLKKNFLYKYTYLIPNFVLYDRKNEEAFIETYNRLHYQYPNNYEFKVKSVNGTLTSRKDMRMLPFNLLNVNVYSDVTNDESFIMPIRFETRKYYSYRIHHSFTENGKLYYKIQYYPAYSSSKLLRSGAFTVEDGTWRITEFLGIGKTLFVDFSFDIKMGEEGVKKYLPEKFTIFRTHLYLGNKVQNRYTATIQYENITEKKEKIKKKNFDIGNRYKVSLDSVLLNKDTVFWNKARTIPPDEKEKTLFKEMIARDLKEAQRHDSVAPRNTRAIELIGQSLIADTRYWYKKTEINYSGFLNPSMLSYSTQDGLNYRLRLGFKTHLVRDKSFSVSSFAGYAFKRKDLVADLSSVLHYNPGRFGTLALSAGKGNQAFSSLYIQKMQDSLTAKGLKFEDMYVNYYKDFYFRIFNNIEVLNGFQVGAGIDYHIRQANKKDNPADNIFSLSEDNLLTTRRYFVPVVRFVWTPEQYYRREGYEKIYMESKYPTFKAEFAYGLKNVFQSNSEYSRFEFDVSQNVHIGLLQSLQYHAGIGFYDQRKTEYFADFTYFAPYKYPETWQDGIGGVFNSLPYNVYSASTLYAQAHFMYETPFLIFTLLPRLARGILYERVYLSQLYTPYVLSYSEIGYGIGNQFVNAAVFGSFHKFNFQQIGAKVVFLLGR